MFRHPLPTVFNHVDHKDAKHIEKEWNEWIATKVVVWTY